MLNDVEKFLARVASIIGIIFALFYWLISKHGFFTKLLCQYSLFFAAVVLIILLFYILLIRAVLKHIALMKKHHVHTEEYGGPNYTSQYLSVLVEAILISSIMIGTIAGFALSGASCALRSLL
jgi:hypothetical protein